MYITKTLAYNAHKCVILGEKKKRYIHSYMY